MEYKGLQLNQEGEKFYFGAVLSNSVDDMLVIPFFEIARERFLEYDLTKSIYNLANTDEASNRFNIRVAIFRRNI